MVGAKMASLALRVPCCVSVVQRRLFVRSVPAHALPVGGCARSPFVRVAPLARLGRRWSESLQGRLGIGVKKRQNS